MKKKNHFLKILVFLAIALALRFFVAELFLADGEEWWIQSIAIIVIFGIGIGYVFNGTTNVIEETTDALKDRTNLAGGLLQAFGTALPDMLIGVTAAIMALQVRDSDPSMAVNLAIIAASATFGSNIYNIFHAYWCIWRQNLANLKNKALLMFPPFKFSGSLIPVDQHANKPSVREMDAAIRILTALTMLTAFVAVSMVMFGHVQSTPGPEPGDVYQLIMPIGVVLFVLCVGVLVYFRKSHRPESPIAEIVSEECYYGTKPTWRLWSDLLVSGVAILFAAESMVKAIEVFSNLTHIPLVLSGLAAGIIGCFGEMLIVHNFSIHPKGRIGDAVVGVAMDNIMTTLGAAVVAIMGGIFFGGNSLVLIFIIILTGNTLLIGQISRLKNSLK